MQMRRVAFVFVVLVAASIAFEPLIHTHPLSKASAVPCAVCVNAVGRLTALQPAPPAPVAIVTTLPALTVATIVPRATMALASRAPPAA